MKIDVNINVHVNNQQSEEFDELEKWTKGQIEGLVRWVTNMSESNAIPGEQESTPVPEPEAEPEPDSEATEKPLTLEDIRIRMGELSKSGKSKQVTELVTSFAAKLSDVPEDKYPELMEAANKLATEEVK